MSSDVAGGVCEPEESPVSIKRGHRPGSAGSMVCGCAGQCVCMHACSEHGVGWLCMLGPHPSLILCGGFPLVAETSCAATEFRCRDGTCIGNSSRCNQFIDCEDASDEMNCSECPDCALFFQLPPQLWPAVSSLEMLPPSGSVGWGARALYCLVVYGKGAESGQE